MKIVFSTFIFLSFISAGQAQSSIFCNQVWMAKNLSVDTYRNGDVIPNVTDTTAWNSLTTGAWCWYGNDSAHNFQKGKLYNWYAVNDPRGLAPLGWHVPSDAEWTTLLNCKEQILFSGGAYNAGYCDINGAFHQTQTESYYWSETLNDTGSPIIYYVQLSRGVAKLTGNFDKRVGLSVLCLKDQ